MGEVMSNGNPALSLLANALATGAMLFVLINIFGPISGAHFNPLVTIAMAFKGLIPKSHIGPYLTAQTWGATLGVWLAHLMFGLPFLQFSTKVRWGLDQWVSEGMATFGLLLTIFALLRSKPEIIPQAVALYITAAYWFTSSTSFANPAVTIARSLTNTFAGIGTTSVLAFVVAQCVGAIIAVLVVQRLFEDKA